MKSDMIILGVVGLVAVLALGFLFLSGSVEMPRQAQLGQAYGSMAEKGFEGHLLGPELSTDAEMRRLFELTMSDFRTEQEQLSLSIEVLKNEIEELRNHLEEAERQFQKLHNLENLEPLK